jgi:hypothetical protein
MSASRGNDPDGQFRQRPIAGQSRSAGGIVEGEMISVTALQTASALTVATAPFYAAGVAVAATTKSARQLTPSNAAVLGVAVLSVILTFRLHLRAMEIDHALSLTPYVAISSIDESTLVALLVINVGWAWLAHRLWRMDGRVTLARTLAVTALAVFSIVLLTLLRFGMGITQGKLSI